MLEFEVAGMTCQNCVKHITNAVLENDPNAQVKADLTTHIVSISHNTQSSDSLSVQIEDAGYPVLNVREVAA